MDKYKKSLLLKDVQSRISAYEYDEKNESKIVPQVIGFLGISAGVGLAMTGLIGSTFNPAVIELAKTGGGIAAVGSGVVTISEMVDDINYTMGNKCNEEFECTKKRLLPFSARRAEKYKNNEKIAEAIVKNIPNKEINKNPDKKGLELSI